MIKAVKDDVLEKLKMKRISVDKLTARPAKPLVAKDSDSVPQAQDTSFKNKNHLEILDMLESFE